MAASMLGREAAMVELAVSDPESKPSAISRLRLLEGVTLIDDVYGSKLAFQTLYENAGTLERQIQLIASLCGWPTPVCWKLGFPPCKLTPTSTDRGSSRPCERMREGGCRTSPAACESRLGRPRGT